MLPIDQLAQLLIRLGQIFLSHSNSILSRPISSYIAPRPARFPLALGIGPGSQMQRPLAIMVTGAFTTIMLFTRIIIAVGYLVLNPSK